MALLKVKHQGKVIQEINLDPGKAYIAGRKQGVDILLENDKAVSREHFKISYDGNAWVLEVLSKYENVFMNGEVIKTISIQEAVNFSLLSYEFFFDPQLSLQSDAEVTGHDPEADEKTVVGLNSQQIAVIKFLDHEREILKETELSDAYVWLAGREATSYLHIEDQRVSRKQFEIRKIGNSYYIVDMRSVNGTKVNGNDVSTTDPLLLVSGDEITVLDNVLIFELRDANFDLRLKLAEQTANDQAMALAVSDQYPVNAMQQHSPNYLQQHQQMQVGMPTPHHQMGPLIAQQPQTLQEKIKNFDYQKNRIRLITVAIAFVAILYALFGDDSGKAPVNNPNQAQDPFTKLNPEQQLLVKQSYQLAKNLYMQGKYELAQNEVNKILELVPNYEDTKEIQRLSREAIFIQDQKRQQEELEKAKAEAEDKIQRQAAICAKKINANITMADLDLCLSEVLQFNPEHPKFEELRAVVNNIVATREAKQASEAAYRDQVEKLKSMYARAADLERKGSNLESIKAYQNVLNSKLPDPSGLKRKAGNKIDMILKMMNSKTASLQAQADQMSQAGNLKGAILTLRKARKIDPTNEALQGKIDKYINDLKKQMMVFYQEGILEESFGNVDGGENKAGAKDKWKKIIEQDIPDGEYYKKAYIKLKKYGAL